MSLDPADLFVSFMIGLLGFALVIFGKRQQRIVHIVAGVLLMVVSVVVPGWLLQLVGAVVVVGLLAGALHLGA